MMRRLCNDACNDKRIPGRVSFVIRRSGNGLLCSRADLKGVYLFACQTINGFLYSGAGY